jgi:hypothetical protein
VAETMKRQEGERDPLKAARGPLERKRVPREV